MPFFILSLFNEAKISFTVAGSGDLSNTSGEK